MGETGFAICHLFTEVPRQGNSEVTSVFESSSHLSNHSMVEAFC